MPLYPDLPVVVFSENYLRTLLHDVQVTSLLDVGAGHGGVYDYHHWDAAPLARREACDIHWIRPMSAQWTLRLGVDAQQLPYADHAFDVVQCMEVLEHVEDPRRALEELVRVAKKFVVISSADETHHQGPEQEAIEKVNVHQKYIRQPRVEDLQQLGFMVCIGENRRHLFAWKYM